jgi:hypothetical protein
LKAAANIELTATLVFVSSVLLCFCLFITVELCLYKQLPFDKEARVFMFLPPLYSHAPYGKDGGVEGLLQLSDIQVQAVDSGMQTFFSLTRKRNRGWVG